MDGSTSTLPADFAQDDDLASFGKDEVAYWLCGLSHRDSIVAIIAPRDEPTSDNIQMPDMVGVLYRKCEVVEVAAWDTYQSGILGGSSRRSVMATFKHRHLCW